VQGAAGFDSLALTVSAGATAEHFVPLHMYAVVSVAVVYTHFRALLFHLQQGTEFFNALTMLTTNGTWPAKGNAARARLSNPRSNRCFDAALTLNLSLCCSSLSPELPLFPVFCILAGVDDLRNNWATTNILRAIILNITCLWILLISGLPNEAYDLVRWIWRADNWLWGTIIRHLGFETLNPFQLQIARTSVVNSFNVPHICGSICWWALAISMWKAFGWIARKCHVPRWFLPLVACAMHFASGYGYPDLCERGPKRDPNKVTLLPPLKSFGGLTEFWIYYAAAPMFLPARFPLELPSVPLSARLETLLGYQVQPRLFWPLLAVLLYAHGWFVVSATASWSDLLNLMPWAPLLQLYRMGYLVKKTSPVVTITSKSYAKFIPGGLPSNTRVWSFNHAVLNICALVRVNRACVRA